MFYDAVCSLKYLYLKRWRENVEVVEAMFDRSTASSRTVTTEAISYTANLSLLTTMTRNRYPSENKN